MQTFTHIGTLRHRLEKYRSSGADIGFVPTMGALHRGHLELVRRCRSENDLVVVSIFVNPVQFNNPDDLKKYPRTLEEDSRMLGEAGCDILFAPSEKEMYPVPETTVYDFGMLDKVMEGAFRPGHFNGVAIVVRKLFQIVQPRHAYFGEKDYQQLQVIRALVKMYSLPVIIRACETVREADGLAMSSRNVRLSPEHRAAAPVIYATLQWVRDHYREYPVTKAAQAAFRQIESTGKLKVEYFEIADAESLMTVESWASADTVIACTAVFAGDVRLIDNIRIF